MHRGAIFLLPKNEQPGGATRAFRSGKREHRSVALRSCPQLWPANQRRREQAPALHTLARAASPSSACHAKRLDCASLLALLDVARIGSPNSGGPSWTAIPLRLAALN